MYKNILIATDGSDIARRALEHGLKLSKEIGAAVTIVTVTEPAAVVGASYATVAGTVIDPLPELIKAQAEAARNLLADAAKVAEGMGVDAETVVVDNAFPAEGITAEATRRGADLIVMGSHGRRGLGRILLGSQTSNVLAMSKIAVLVTR